MGFRFQKRIKLLPGVHFNLSKSGVSTSIGGRGASVNFRKGKTRATVGLPGTGLSYVKDIRRAATTIPSRRTIGRRPLLRQLALLVTGALTVLAIVSLTLLIRA